MGCLKERRHFSGPNRPPDRQTNFRPAPKPGDKSVAAPFIYPTRIVKTIPYDHALFSLGALRAQQALPALNAAARGTTETFFAGSYFRYGFHEDAFLSAVQLSELLLGRDPWGV